MLGVLAALVFGITPTAAITFTTSLTPITLHARPGQVLTREVRLTSHAFADRGDRPEGRSADDDDSLEGGSKRSSETV